MVRLIETVISGAIGAVDIMLENQPRKEVFAGMYPEDVYRVALTAGSFIASWMNIEGKRPGEEGYSDLAFYVSLPLVEKTIYKMVKKTTTTQTAGTLRFTPAPATITPATTPATKQVVQPQKIIAP